MCKHYQGFATTTIFDIACPICASHHSMPGIKPHSTPYFGLREVCALCRCVFRVRFHMIGEEIYVLDVLTREGKQGTVLSRRPG